MLQEIEVFGITDHTTAAISSSTEVRHDNH
jgi:hypothetical protein